MILPVRNFPGLLESFDRVCHYILFQKLIEKQIPLILVRFIMYWYKNQMITIKWNNVFSRCFSITNGVRQGGILSPYLFNIYMDQLSVKLNQLDIGCCIGDKCLNNLMYADDIAALLLVSKAYKGLLILASNLLQSTILSSIAGKPKLCIFLVNSSKPLIII